MSGLTPLARIRDYLLSMPTSPENSAALFDLGTLVADDDTIPCSVCGSTETVEITHEDEHSEQSITICSDCGNDG